MHDIFLIIAGAILGFATLLFVLAPYGAKRGCPFCKGVTALGGE